MFSLYYIITHQQKKYYQVSKAYKNVPISIENAIYRIIDANLNRLREALRVIEEHFRFIHSDAKTSLSLKKMRHGVREIAESFDSKKLLLGRDTKTDPFSRGTVALEKKRISAEDILCAALKRAQEASRVLEEYSKITAPGEVCELAKRIRFSLYALEKDILGSGKRTVKKKRRS